MDSIQVSGVRTSVIVGSADEPVAAGSSLYMASKMPGDRADRP